MRPILQKGNSLQESSLGTYSGYPDTVARRDVGFFSHRLTRQCELATWPSAALVSGWVVQIVKELLLMKGKLHFSSHLSFHITRFLMSTPTGPINIAEVKPL